MNVDQQCSGSRALIKSTVVPYPLGDFWDRAIAGMHGEPVARAVERLFALCMDAGYLPRRAMHHCSPV